MPLNMPAVHIALISFGLSTSLMILGIVSLLHIESTSVFREQASFANEKAKENQEIFEKHYRIWLIARLRQVGFQSIGLLTNYACGVYVALLAMRVPPHGTMPLPRQLPTLLIGTANIC